MFVPDKSVLIVGSPRTGSTLLSSAVASTGALGIPQEYFWRMVEQRHAEELGVDAPTDGNYATYLDAALRFGTTPNGVFGAKLFWEHQKDLVRRTAYVEGFAHRPANERLWALFGPDLRVVYLRRNCLDVALSLWRAEVTNEWGRTEHDAPAPPPDTLDTWRVSYLHAETHAADVGWPPMMTAGGITPLVIGYDEVVADLAGSVARIAAFAEVAMPNATAITPQFTRQADEVTDAFKQEWIRITGGCEACST